jgi:alpha-beta hydrolase superfamily lysophospholipase
VRHFESCWKTHDGLQLHAQGWQPDGEARGVVALVHGLGEHSGRYAHVGAALCDRGYVLLAFDLRGHGNSQGPRGHAPRFEAWMQDLDLSLRHAEHHYPGLPVFLYGHSLGAILALNHALRRCPQLQGIMATGLAVRTSLERQTAKLALVHLLGRVVPKMTLPSGLDPRGLSRDPKVVSAYVDDPLVHDRLSVGTALSLLRAVAYTLDHADELHLPLLLMHGGADSLVYPQGALEFADLVTGGCTLKLWDGLYHEIHNEPERREVLATMIAWLDEHIS